MSDKLLGLEISNKQPMVTAMMFINLVCFCSVYAFACSLAPDFFFSFSEEIE
jgi:hypothetical protein